MVTSCAQNALHPPLRQLHYLVSKNRIEAHCRVCSRYDKCRNERAKSNILSSFTIAITNWILGKTALPPVVLEFQKAETNPGDRFTKTVELLPSNKTHRLKKPHCSVDIQATFLRPAREVTCYRRLQAVTYGTLAPGGDYPALRKGLLEEVL